MKRVIQSVLILWVLVIAASATCLAGGTAATPAKRAITFDDLIGLDRISEVQVSPEGK